jgi:hypothetical protein
MKMEKAVTEGIPLSANSVLPASLRKSRTVNKRWLSSVSYAGNATTAVS